MTNTSKHSLHGADLSVLSIPRSEEPERPPRSTTWRRIIGGLLIAILLGFGGYRLSTWSHDTTSVEVVTAIGVSSSGDGVSSEITASGYIVAQRQAQVASKGTGRVEYLGVQVGDRVQRGQVIARLEQADMAANLREAQAKLDVAQAALSNARPELRDASLNHQRLQTLVAHSFVTQAEFDVAVARLRHAKAAVRSAEAAINAATAELQAAEVQKENTNIRAPFDGTVVRKYAEVGEVVAPLAASASSRGAVVQIADLTSLMMEADVSESMIGRIQVGQPAVITLDAIPDHRYNGEVGQIVPTADRSKATILTKIRFMDSDERIFPEMSAKVVIRTRPLSEALSTRGAVVEVPSNAVTIREGRRLVLVVRNGIVSEQTVEIDRQLDTRCEIRGNLMPGDQVIIHPAAHLREGDSVRPVKKDS